MASIALPSLSGPPEEIRTFFRSWVAEDTNLTLDEFERRLGPNRICDQMFSSFSAQDWYLLVGLFITIMELFGIYTELEPYITVRKLFHRHYDDVR